MIHKTLINRATIAAAVFAGALLWAPSASAAPPAPIPKCSQIFKIAPGAASYSADLAPTVVYVTGSSAIKPLIAALAPAIFAATTRPATIVYLSQGSCAGVSAVLAGKEMPTTNPASYWDVNSDTPAGTKTLKEQNCTLEPTTFADVGVSDVFTETCGQSIQSLPVADFQGPIQAMTFAVNRGSKENSISAEAAYLTFGLHSLAPWTESASIFRRNSGSGTQSMIAAAINVDAKSWTGVDKSNSDGVYNALSGLISQADKDKSIGILAADYSYRDPLKQLAYQHYGQRCGYRPDVSNLDKKNVREGRYAIWGPLHLLTRVDGSGLAQKLEARDLISYLLGTVPPPLGVDLIRTESTLHVVPPCAMKVQRKSEMGAITPFTPVRSCACAYDKEGTGTTTCTPCTTNAQCTGTQSCSFGYCE